MAGKSASSSKEKKTYFVTMERNRKIAQKKSPLFFKEGDLFPREEDAQFEFKMHINFSVEELPDWLQTPQYKRTRRAISRNINGFLNSGLGGNIFLGVQDDRTVSGIPLSNSQK